MKLFGWSLGFFFAFFALGWLFSARAPLGVAPIPAPAVTPSPVVSAPLPPKDSAKVAATLLRGHGAELFTVLFDEQALRNRRFAELEPALSARFRSSYPREAEEFRRELVSRMGILKALSVTYGERVSLSERTTLLSFYRGLALRRREPMLVRRQALRNLTVWMKTLSEKKRTALIARMPAALLASAPLSERELLEGIFSHAE